MYLSVSFYRTNTKKKKNDYKGNIVLRCLLNFSYCSFSLFQILPCSPLSVLDRIILSLSLFPCLLCHSLHPLFLSVARRLNILWLNKVYRTVKIKLLTLIT